MKERELTKEEEFQYARLSMAWHGWGSPVGIGILVLSAGAFLACLRYAGLLG